MNHNTEASLISRRRLLVTVSLALVVPTVTWRPPTAQAAAPKQGYGRGYTGGY